MEKVGRPRATPLLTSQREARQHTATSSIEHGAQEGYYLARLENLKGVLSTSDDDTGEIGMWSSAFQLDNKC